MLLKILNQFAYTSYNIKILFSKIFVLYLDSLKLIVIGL